MTRKDELAKLSIEIADKLKDRTQFSCYEINQALLQVEREALAAGLEQAADKADRYPCNPEARRGMASLADWCRAEAKRVKEGK